MKKPTRVLLGPELARTILAMHYGELNDIGDSLFEMGADKKRYGELSKGGDFALLLHDWAEAIDTHDTEAKRQHRSR